MNRDELRAALELRRVHESVHISGTLSEQGESYSLVKDGNSWKDVRRERGEFTRIETGLAEQEACDSVYWKFTDAFSWTQ